MAQQSGESGMTPASETPETLICSNCLHEIHRGEPTRYVGTYITHFHERCIELLRLSTIDLERRMREALERATAEKAEEARIVDRVWTALGISTYQQAQPYAIDEHVANLKQRAQAAESRAEAMEKALRTRIMSEQLTLKPCPFCGGEASQSIGKTSNGKDWPYIECSQCGACAEPDMCNRRACEPVQPVAWARNHGEAYTSSINTADAWRECGHEVTPLYAHPPASAADARDARRYRWLREHWFAMASMWNRNTSPGCHYSAVARAGDVETLDAAIDAALAQEGNR